MGISFMKAEDICGEKIDFRAVRGFLGCFLVGFLGKFKHTPKSTNQRSMKFLILCSSKSSRTSCLPEALITNFDDMFLNGATYTRSG